jgi:hypothetical protein
MLKSALFVHVFCAGLFVALFTIGCKPSAQSEEVTETADSAATKYTLTPFAPSQEFADAEIVKMEYRNGRFDFQLAGESFKLGMQTPDAAAKGCANSAEGQHIHLIVDNMPYVAKYESSFEYDLEDGEHHILAFLSRSYHESLKQKKASVAVKVTVKDKSIVTTEAITQPMLFYSRPKGAYEGDDDIKRIMLDYYLINPDPAHAVKASINGEEHFLTTWQPYYIDGLPAGENEITLTLVDASGNRVNTDLNPVSRKFLLNPTPAENQ